MDKIKYNKYFSIMLIFHLLVVIGGCGYTAKRVLPENIKTISLILFSNKTLQYKIENIFSDKLIEEFIMDGRLKVSNKDSADSILSGEISQYLKQPAAVDKNKNILEYKLTLIISVSLKDNKDAILYEEKNIRASYNYYPERQSEEEALDRLMKNMSRKLVKEIIERE
ncbi:MAG: hypothetical protein HY934_01965 [Candidatus Firestonebacteria bacterium]|nr:hypothetical protein [Candidatus Firestonebacteria bacterium]